MRTVVAALLVMVLGSVVPSTAAEQLVRGRLFVVSNPLRSNPSRRLVTVTAVDLHRGQTLVGDPVADGMALEFVTNGASSASQAFVLPPGAFHEPNGPGWTRHANRAGSRVSLTYVDDRGENGSVTFFSLRVTTLSVRMRARLEGRGNNPTIDIVPPNPGSGGGLVAAVHGGDTYCVGFGGAAGGKITDNDQKLFRMVKPRGRACPGSP